MHDKVPAVFLYPGTDFYGTSTRLLNFGDGRLFLNRLSPN